MHTSQPQNQQTREVLKTNHGHHRDIVLSKIPWVRVCLGETGWVAKELFQRFSEKFVILRRDCLETVLKAGPERPNHLENHLCGDFFIKWPF